MRPACEPSSTSPTSFLNVDLDLRSRTNLAPLVDAFGAAVIVLYSGTQRGSHLLSLELGGRLSLASTAPTADRCVAALVRLVETLAPAPRRVWARASLRQLNIGVQAGVAPKAGSPAFVTSLRAATVRGAARVNAEIVLTIYPVPRSG